jgi:iron complex transport system substrate-binding protein
MSSADRIVSLLPSTTEIACALGLRDRLFGRSHECDYPEDVTRLPVCTAARFDDGTSRVIDDRVRDLVTRGLSVYEVNAEQLREIQPDLVLTQDQCRVCAASLEDVETALREWTGAKPRVLSLIPGALADVWNDIIRVGDAAGVPERARALCSELTERVTTIGEQTGGIPARPRVACIEWIDPLMGAGNWIPELVHLAGGEPLFGSTGAHSPMLEADALFSADPDVVLVVPCGFDIARSRKELPVLSGRPEWQALRAVREGRVFLADGNAYFNRPGPRLVETLEILAELLHPDRFSFGHEGAGWQRLES